MNRQSIPPAYTVYLIIGKGECSIQMMNLLQRNPFVRPFVDVQEIESLSHYMSLGFDINRGLPILRHGRDIFYGGQAIAMIKNVIKQNRPTVGSSVEGSEYASLHDDDTVTFDPSKIVDASSFVIPEGPAYNSDVSTLLAKAEAEREILDAELNKRGRY